jgi:hypothetical protein
MLSKILTSMAVIINGKDIKSLIKSSNVVRHFLTAIIKNEDGNQIFIFLKWSELLLIPNFYFSYKYKMVSIKNLLKSMPKSKLTNKYKA